jgi:hypothetical protein
MVCASLGSCSKGTRDVIVACLRRRFAERDIFIAAPVRHAWEERRNLTGTAGGYGYTHAHKHLLFISSSPTRISREQTRTPGLLCKRCHPRPRTPQITIEKKEIETAETGQDPGAFLLPGTLLLRCAVYNWAYDMAAAAKRRYFRINHLEIAMPRCTGPGTRSVVQAIRRAVQHWVPCIAAHWQPDE